MIPAFSSASLGGAVPADLAWVVYSPLHILWAGGEAVWVFFVLSGFVLTRAAMKPTFSLRSYYPSRLIRLYLPVIGAVLFSVLTALAVPRMIDGSAGTWLLSHRNPVSLAHIVRDMTLIAGAEGSLDSPLWSLRWEVLFSLLLPLFVWLAVRVKAWLLLPGCLVVATAGAAISDARGQFGPTLGLALLYLPVFLVGCVFAAHLGTVLRIAARTLRGRGARAVELGVFVVAIIALTMSWSMGAALYSRGSAWTTPITLIGAALLVLLAVASPSTKTVLELRPVQWLGRISFSLYLIHEPIVVSIGLLLPPPLRWLTVLIAVPIALCAGWVFFRVVESPAHRLAQAASRRLAAPAPIEARS